MTCTACHADVLVEIRVTIAGTKFTMHSCPSCETRWWDQDGETVEVRSVLQTAAAA
jgi:hypothetical protein